MALNDTSLRHCCCWSCAVVRTHDNCSKTRGSSHCSHSQCGWCADAGTLSHTSRSVVCRQSPASLAGMLRCVSSREAAESDNNQLHKQATTHRDVCWPRAEWGPPSADSPPRACR